MGDQTSSTMNFDLNLDPYPSSSDDESSTTVPVSAEEAASINRLHIMRARQSLRLALRHLPLPRYSALDTSNNNSTNFNARDFLVNVSDEGRRSSEEEMLVSNAKKEEDGLLGKETDEKANDSDMDFYNCNICLDVATNPVVTCCGHLFCWSCIYCWLNVHSKAKDCPVCKGEVNSKSVMPIYGRGKVNTRETKEKYNIVVPPRPRANRVESMRQTIERSANMTVDELLRHVRNIGPPTGEPEPETAAGGTASEMYNLLVRRILTSRAIRSEQNDVVQPNEVAAVVMESNPPGPSLDDDRPPWILPVLLQTQSRNRTNATNTDGAVETYLLDHPTDIIYDEPPSLTHRDSFSSVAAVMHSGSGTLDTAMEIDSVMSFSTSSSARRRGIDGGDSRTLRRRLN